MRGKPGGPFDSPEENDSDKPLASEAEVKRQTIKLT